MREVWQDLPGTAVSDLTSSPDFPNAPTSTNLVLDYFEAPVDTMDYYGQRLHGYIVPPVTGDYTFWIASDDGGELWLSTDSSSANQRLIAYVTSWTNSRQWDKETNQKSTAIRLQAGVQYYIAALQKEGSGGDNLAVRWLRPDSVDDAPIPTTYLLPYGLPPSPPGIAQQPTNTTVLEGAMALFNIKVTNLDPVAIRWQRNGVDLPGASLAVLNYGPVTMADNGAQFRAVVSNSAGATNSAAATLTVLVDIVRPAATLALNLGPTSVRVTFSEPLDPADAVNPANYALDQGATVTAVTSSADHATVMLTTSPLVFGTTYTLALSNLKDRAATPNPILPGSTITFTAYEYAPADIGTPAQAGHTRTVPGGFEVVGTGTDIGGTTDQFQFGWQERSGDFDLQVRVASVTISDPYLHAGLMARESLEPNSRFAASFASSAQLGCFFESRATTGASAETQTSAGGFPVNYPQTWLRLRRTGQTLTGFASLDAQSWVQLGARTFTGLPSRLYFGLAVTSDNAARPTTAQFQDLGPTTSQILAEALPTREPLGPCSRATGMIISEIMYHPPARTDGRNLEFVELYNARSVFEDLTGWRLTGDIDFQFPDGFRLEAGAFVVIAASPDDVTSVYGITNVLGPYAHDLPNREGSLLLLNNSGAVRLELDYRDAPPWPVAADGAGHSLVLARPSYGENDPRSWAASQRIGGSPGNLDAVDPAPQRTVVINEFLANTDDPILDYVELYNHSNTPVDLSGCWLTDDPRTKKFTLPPGTSLPARGFLSWDQQQLGFALDSAGESLYLFNASSNCILDAVHFGGQENGVASGRFPDGAPSIRRLNHPTPGSANSTWLLEDVVINELMFNPISNNDDDEYLELHNRSQHTVDLSGWRFVAGIDFTFPPDSSLPPGGYLVVAKNNARLRTNYPQLNAENTLGDYGGSLRNAGECLALAKPNYVIRTNAIGDLATNLIPIVVSEVTYADGGRWGTWADGGGSSLELIDPHADLSQPSNWADSDETQKSLWTEVAFTGKLDNGQGSYPPNRLHLLMQGAGECLVDDVEISGAGGTNLLTNGGFENGSSGWSFQGNHSSSTVISIEAASGANCLHVRGQGHGDTGVNSLRVPLASGLASGNTATIRAKVRWLTGWPEVLFRTRGNWIELPARLSVPPNLGSPGLPNSRRVANAGPAIYQVNHNPALPKANQTVTITCRVSDPDGLASLTLSYRVDPSTTPTLAPLRDDGSNGDAIAGDGIYSARIPGRAAGNLVAFHIQAVDLAPQPATNTFPANVPSQEALIRWDDPQPFGTFAHYHLWNTRATDSARRNALDNTYRDATLVYNHSRVIYNVGFRDKGSPYHGGSGDYAVEVPSDERLLGATERIFASTGNGGSEETALRGQVSAWIGQQLGIPYLHSHYLRLYRNGSQHRNISEDLEQPDQDYAERWFPEGGEGDLFKIAVWFEFQDNNSTFGSVGATLQPFTTTGGAYKLARYRWNWQRRPASDRTANNFTNIFNLVSALNDNTTNYVNRVLNLADIEQWMHVFAFDRILGNWDSWTYNVGQNMYLYQPPGQRARIMPWDIDFVLGLGDGTSSALWGGGQDPVVDKMYNNPALRRMSWRAFQDAVNGPMLPESFGPQVDARRAILLKNNVTSLTAPSRIYTYLSQRRTYILNQLKAIDAAAFSITSNNGNDFTATAPSITLEGTAPFAVASLEINGAPYPVTWPTLTTFRVLVPLAQVTNRLQLTARNNKGQLIPAATDSITVTYPGAVPQPQDFVVLNEIHYAPVVPNASFLELYNRSTTTPFDLTGYRLEGVEYAFAPGAIISPNGYLLLVKDRAVFANTYGATIPVFDEFPGSLDQDGEYLKLVKPGPSPTQDLCIGDVHYRSALPWPANAAALGSSLQLIDPAQAEYRVANWTALPTNDLNRTTPGRPNPSRQSLPPFPAVWINEVLPQNVTGLPDAAGDRDPWIELYNAGSEIIDLSNCYLSDAYTNLTQWPFPAGTTLPPQQFLLVWADGEPQESTPGALHANFRLNPTNGTVALTRFQGTPAAPAVLDHVDYLQFIADRSLGCSPDGEPRQRWAFFYATPGSPNNPAQPALSVVFNELMAGNASTLADPADGQFEDWFELYNPSAHAIDLSHYRISDNLTNTSKFIIPLGTIVPAGGFLLAWADEETGQNAVHSDLHVNFKLALDGEQLGLFTPDGTLIDSVTFGPQTNDISCGRYPDGAALPLVFLETPTPRQPNLVAGANQPPVLAPISNQTVAEQRLLSFPIAASDPDPGQSLSYSLSVDAPAGASLQEQSGLLSWTPSEAQGPGTYTFTIRVKDNGTPTRIATQNITINVTEANQPPSLAPIPDQSIDEGTPLAFDITASDPDLPANTLAFSLDSSAPEGASIDPQSGRFAWTPAEHQGNATYPITVRVNDHGSPSLQDSRSFQVTVNEIANPPAMDFVQPQVTDELIPWTITVAASDTDTPPSDVRFNLDLSPVGARIDSVTGVISWTPTEEQGPTNAIFVVRATEVNPPFLSNSRTFSVQVNEANLPPSLAPIANQSAQEGVPLILATTAFDPDLPRQKLTFSLAPGAPNPMSIDPDSGVLTWPISADHGAATNPVTVRVADDGLPALSDARSFTVIVQGQPKIVINEIMYQPVNLNAEFIELLNRSSSATVDLSGAQLVGSNLQFAFAANTRLRPGEYLVVVKNRIAFAGAYTNSAAIAGEFLGSLGTTSDHIRLLAPGSQPDAEILLDEVFYSNAAPWPTAAYGQGGSLQLIDPWQDNLIVGNWTAIARPSSTQPRNLILMTNQWRFNQNRPDLGASWISPEYDDSSWPQGPALFFKEDAALPAPGLTPLTLGATSYYFRTHFTLPSSSWGLSLQFTTALDDGAVFYLNGQETYRLGIDPNSTVAYGTLASRTVGDATLEGPFDMPASALRPGDNVLAVEVHQNNTTSSDVVFGMSLVVTGNPAASTPGTTNSVLANLPAFSPVRLNEILPANPSGLTDAAGDHDPWIELINPARTPTPLEGYFLTDNLTNLTRWPFPKGASLAAGEFRLVWADGEPNETSTAEWHAGFRLNPAVGTIAITRLQFGLPVVVDYLTYSGIEPDNALGLLPDGQAFSLQYLTPPTPAEPNQYQPPPAIHSLLPIDHGWFGFAFATIPGRVYRVEFATQLDSPDWQPLHTLTATTQETMTFDYATPDQPTRFYRVVLLHP